MIELITELNEKAFRRDYRIKCNGINVTVEDGIQHDVIWMEPKRGVPPPLFPLQTFIYEFIHNFFSLLFYPNSFVFFQFSFLCQLLFWSPSIYILFYFFFLLLFHLGGEVLFNSLFFFMVEIFIIQRLTLLSFPCVIQSNW